MPGHEGRGQLGARRGVRKGDTEGSLPIAPKSLMHGLPLTSCGSLWKVRSLFRPPHPRQGREVAPPWSLSHQGLFCEDWLFPPSILSALDTQSSWQRNEPQRPLLLVHGRLPLGSTGLSLKERGARRLSSFLLLKI